MSKDMDNLVQEAFDSMPPGRFAIAAAMSEAIRAQLYGCPRCGCPMELVGGHWHGHSREECVIYSVMDT